MAKEKKICPDCGSRMKRTNSRGLIEIFCPRCELGIAIERKNEHKWKELLLEAKRQWIKEKVLKR